MEDIKENTIEAFNYYSRIKEGDPKFPEASYKMGTMFLNGIEGQMEPNVEYAIKFLRKAEKNNYPGAKELLENSEPIKKWREEHPKNPSVPSINPKSGDSTHGETSEQPNDKPDTPPVLNDNEDDDLNPEEKSAFEKAVEDNREFLEKANEIASDSSLTPDQKAQKIVKTLPQIKDFISDHKREIGTAVGASALLAVLGGPSLLVAMPLIVLHGFLKKDKDKETQRQQENAKLHRENEERIKKELDEKKGFEPVPEKPTPGSPEPSGEQQPTPPSPSEPEISSTKSKNTTSKPTPPSGENTPSVPNIVPKGVEAAAPEAEIPPVPPIGEEGQMPNEEEQQPQEEGLEQPQEEAEQNLEEQEDMDAPTQNIPDQHEIETDGIHDTPPVAADVHNPSQPEAHNIPPSPKARSIETLEEQMQDEAALQERTADNIREAGRDSETKQMRL